MSRRSTKDYHYFSRDGMMMYGQIDDSFYVSDYVGEEGRRTKQSHPYSYEEFYIFGRDSDKSDCVGVYSDRLHGWNYISYDRACKRLGKRFDQMSQREVNDWFTTYYNRPMICVTMIEGCNQSNGYPYWAFYIKDANPVKEKKNVK